MNAIEEIVVSNALLVVVLAVVIAVVGRFWKNPQGLHLLWLLVLLKFITPALLTVPIHLPSRPIAVEAKYVPVLPSDKAATSPDDEAATEWTGRQNHAPFDQEPIAGADKAADAPSHTTIPWLGILAGLWCIGIVGTGFWQAFRILRFHRLLHSAQPASSDVLSMVAEVGKQLGLRRIPRVRMLPVRVSPMVLSVGFRPQLLLPMELFKRLETTAQSSLLAHELAHVRRKDHLVRLFELLVTTLFWWHPVVWWACWELRKFEDLCCDAMVVGIMPENRKVYATALMNTLDFLCDGSIAAPLGITATQSSVLLTRRIAMLKNHSGVTHLTFGRFVLLVLVAAVPMSIAFAAKPPKGDESNSAKAGANAEEASQPTVVIPSQDNTADSVAVSPSPATPKANNQSGKISPAKNADEVSLATDQSATKAGAYTESKSAPIHGLTAIIPNADRRAIAEIEKLRGEVITEVIQVALGVGLPPHAQQVTDVDLQHLRGLSRLQRLHLESTKVTDAGLQNLKGLSQLQVLVLVCPKVTDAGLQNLKWLSQLRLLMCNHTQVTDSGLEHLKGFGYLQKLWFIDTQVTDEGVKKLRQSLPHCEIWRGRDEQDLMRHLPFLSSGAANDQPDKTSAAKPADGVSPASDQSATKAGAKTESKPAPTPGLAAEPNTDEAKAIAEFEKLGGKVTRDVKSPGKPVISVHLERTKVTDAGLAHLEGLKQLHDLNLSFTKVTDAGLGRLRNLSQLQTLSLRNTQVTDAGLEHLRALSQLRRLDVIETQITDVGLEHLKGLTQLQALHLDYTKITGAGLVYLEGLTQLQKLGLSLTKITDVGLHHLTKLTRLQLLGLGSTKVTDAGLVHLNNMNQLVQLVLDGTRVGDAGLVHLKGLAQLRDLGLDGTKVTDSGLEYLKGLTNLQSLDLRGTKVTDAGVKKLQQALPNCKIERSDSPSVPTPKTNDQSAKVPAAKPAAEVSPGKDQS